MIDLQPFGEKAHAFAFRLVEQDKRINILDGSIRSSKTWSMIPKMLQLCDYEVEGQRIITGVSKQTIKQNILNDLFDLVGEDNYTYNSHSGDLTLFDSKWIVIGAKDEGSEKYIRGLTAGIIYSDELSLMPKSFLLMLFGRMSPKNARFYATTNPDTPYHFLKEEILDNPDYQAHLYHLHFTLDDNPNLSEEYKVFVRNAYTGVWYDRYILGLWVIAAGAIYRDCLTEENYYIDETRPLGLTGQGGYVERTVSVDYGTGNAMVFGDIYDDGQVCWLEHEYYWDSRKKRQQKTDREYADDLVEFLGTDLRQWPVIIVDPSAASFKAELRSRNIVVLDGKNDVDNGIRRVSTMLARNMLRIHKINCPNTVRELGTYAWSKTLNANGKEQPSKVNDHSADMVRYFVETKINDWRLAA
jgi:PBSX family phage terminase large subunit